MDRGDQALRYLVIGLEDRRQARQSVQECDEPIWSGGKCLSGLGGPLAAFYAVSSVSGREWDDVNWLDRSRAQQPLHRPGWIGPMWRRVRRYPERLRPAFPRPICERPKTAMNVTRQPPALLTTGFFRLLLAHVGTGKSSRTPPR